MESKNHRQFAALPVRAGVVLILPAFYVGKELGQIIRAKQVNDMSYLRFRPVPPSGRKKGAAGFLIETVSNVPRRVSRHNRIRSNISRNHGTRRDYGAVANRDPRQDRATGGQPYVIADCHVTTCSAEVLDTLSFLEKHRKRITRHPVGSVVTSQENVHVVRNRSIGTDP